MAPATKVIKVHATLVRRSTHDGNVELSRTPSPKERRPSKGGPLMGRLVVNMFVTLDGVIQSPGGPDEDPESGFPYGGWQAQFLDDVSGAAIAHGIERSDALLLGRKTYDIFAGYWPSAPAHDPIARKFNAIPKYVASRTRTEVSWTNARLIEGDLATGVKSIKAHHDEVHMWGSADLLGSLLREGLVDRLVLILYPIILGAGKRLFADGVGPARFKLVESRSFEGGGVLLAYEPGGEPKYGTIGQA